MLKQRLITAFIALPIIWLTIQFSPPYLMALIFSLVVAIAAYEFGKLLIQDSRFRLERYIAILASLTVYGTIVGPFTYLRFVFITIGLLALMVYCVFRLNNESISFAETLENLQRILLTTIYSGVFTFIYGPGTPTKRRLAVVAFHLISRLALRCLPLILLANGLVSAKCFTA